MKGVVSSANGLDADLVAVTGDLADGTVETRRADVELLRTARQAGGIPGAHPGRSKPCSRRPLSRGQIDTLRLAGRMRRNTRET